MEIGFFGALVKALLPAPILAVRKLAEPQAGPQLPPAAPAPPPEKRRSRPPHYRPRPRLVVSIEESVDHLIQFMNAEGKTGVFCAAEIDSHYLSCCELLDLEPHEPRFVRECLAGRRLKIGLKRLLTPEYRAIHVRTGKDRLVLYRIPKFRSASGIEPVEPVAISAAPAVVQTTPGNPPATAAARRVA